MSELFSHGALRVMRHFLAQPAEIALCGYDLKKQTKLSLGMLYPMLTRWENAGWVTSRSTTGATATMRKVYVMTETGREFALDLLRPLQLSTNC